MSRVNLKLTGPQQCVLARLIKGPAWGVELEEALARFSGKHSLRSCTLTLNALERRKLIGKTWEPAQQDYRYQLTVKVGPPAPGTKPHPKALKADAPCVKCGGLWAMIQLDTSDLDVLEIPVFTSCASCGERVA